MRTLMTCSAVLAGLSMATIPAPTLAADDTHPLIRLAQKIPADAKGQIVLNDVAASRRQVQALGPDVIQAMTPVEQKFMAFSPLMNPGSFDFLFLAYAEVLKLDERLGFWPLDIDQVAGWGEVPRIGSVLQGAVLKGAEPAMQKALTAWGHDRSTRNGLPTWGRLDDLAIDNEANNGPFVGALGMSTRFALGDGWLIHTRTWPLMDKALAGGPNLMDVPGIERIMRVATTVKGLGDLLVALTLEPQQPRISLADRLLGQRATPQAIAEFNQMIAQADVPPVPAYRHGMILAWQDGFLFHGALALDYPDLSSAMAAVDAIRAGVAKRTSIVTGRPLDTYLPKDITGSAIELDGGAVAMVTFSRSLKDDRPRGRLRFLAHPGGMLAAMAATRELELLLVGQ